jgi:uncharacterized protein YkwD
LTFGRVLGGALALTLIAGVLALAQTEPAETSVLGEGATTDPHLYAEQVESSPDEPEAPEKDEVLELIETTTTEYVTTTTAAVETSTTAIAASTQPTTATTKPKPGSPTTTAPPATTTTVASGGFNSGYESSFVSKINSLRANNGLGSFARNGSLDAEARAWSKHMAAQGSLSHSGIGRLIPPWSSVAENVGTGPSVSKIFNALVASSSHLQHMLGSYDNVGVGVWVDSHGVLWTTHIFSK